MNLIKIFALLATKVISSKIISVLKLVHPENLDNLLIIHVNSVIMSALHVNNPVMCAPSARKAFS